MKIFFQFIIASIAFVFFSSSAWAVGCVPVEKVSFSSITTKDDIHYFKCYVEVSKGNGGSPNISCGIKNNEKTFPKNYCPSDPPYFAGWQGNIATFNCAVPATESIIDPRLSPELVGYDFSTQGCDVNNNGKSIALTGLTYKGTSSTGSTSNSVDETKNNEDVQTTIKKLLNAFLVMSGHEPVPITNSGPSGSNTIQPTVDPSEFLNYQPNSGIASSVMNLIQSIVSNPSCGKVISRSNVENCIKSIRPPLSAAVEERIRHSATAWTYLQCVGWVETLTDLLGYPTLKKNPAAYQYGDPGGYSNKYVFISKNAGIPIQPGDIVMWSGGAYGHIAFVIEVKDNIRFRVTEANMSPGRIDWNRWTTTTQSNLKGWLRPKI